MKVTSTRDPMPPPPPKTLTITLSEAEAVTLLTGLRQAPTAANSELRVLLDSVLAS